LSDDNSETENEKNSGGVKENVEVTEEINLEIKSETLPEDGTVKIISIEDLQHNLIGIGSMNISSETSESNLDNSSVEDIETLSMTIKLDHQSELPQKGLSKMKVAGLRAIALSNGLVENIDTANKIKKENLIKMLQE
jgi:hypothetical protein